MAMQKLIYFLLGIIITGALVAEMQPSVMPKVMISKTIDHPALNKTTQGIIDALAEKGFVANKNMLLRIESAQANGAMALQIANKFVYQNPDVIIGIGTMTAQSFIKYSLDNRSKLIFSSVTDPVAAYLMHTDKRNIHNICGVSNFVAIEPQLQLIKKIQPKLTKIGIIYNPGEINSVKINKELESLCPKYNIKLHKQAVIKTNDVVQAATKLIEVVDAIYISNDNTALSSLPSIIQIATKHGIPVYVSDTDAVELGALAALGPNQYAIGKQTGNMVARVLNGEDINKIIVEYPQHTELFINTKMARKLNIQIPNNILKRATLISEEVPA